MNPEHDVGWLHAFVDGELDLAQRLAVEDRMRVDADCARRVEQIRASRDAVREGGDYHAAPRSLHERLAASMPAPTAPLAPKRAAIRFAGASVLRRWQGWAPLVASFASMAALVVALDGAGWLTAPDGRVVDDVVAGHVRSTLGEHLVDVASSDRHQVKPWLSSKLDFSPPVAALPLAGSVFLGARVDYVDGHAVAALVYRQGAHTVNAFVWPTSGPATAPVFVERRGFRVAHWSSGRMVHWVVSDLGRDEFGEVVGAIRTAEGG